MPSRIILRLEVTPAAKQQLDKVCDLMGMTQVTVTSRLLEWFAHQDQAIQRMIVSHVPAELQRDLARLMLRKIADKA